ncbi:Bug family tripartite tricarboxylate transporter substrate binding protein [Halobellus captivus]|uniref:Bug family tripartite tricarboxylate transporter substrate binding protein n=1 Tax=Halobellus captivus TaxID=2592614 RepID=UPI0011AA1E0E|nr:tripartite tricarboxylate transporter substrate-binding protein [Halobellus captivus]
MDSDGMPKFTRRKSLKAVATTGGLLGLSGCSALVPGRGNQYPSESITINIPFGKGGQTDLETRLIADFLQDELDASISVTNNPEAGGAVNYQQFSSAEPDGYTLSAFWYPVIATHPQVLGAFDYDPDAFTLLGQFSQVPLNIMTGYDSDIERLPDLVDFAEEQAVTMGFTGPVAPVAIPMLQLQESVDLSIDPVFVGGGGALGTEAQAGRVDVAANTFDTTANNFAAERTKPVSILSEPDEELISYYEETQGISLSEDMFVTEYPDLVENPPLMTSMKGLMGPPELPDDIQQVLVQALKNVMSEGTGWHEEMRNIGSYPTPTFGDELEQKWDDYKSQFNPYIPTLQEFASEHS